MRHLNYTLTPSRINNVKGRARPYKIADGGGLYVQVMPTGIKTWRYRYVLGGAPGDVRIGRYPEVGVADARDRHFELRQLVERGQDPAVKLAQEREEVQARAQPKRSGDDLEGFSKLWVAERLSTRTQGYRAQILSRLERFVWPAIGDKALAEVKPRHVLEILEARRSTPNTAEGVRVIIQQMFNYAIQKLIVETNPALPLRGVIEVPRAQHHRHLNEDELGAFWNAVARQGAHFVTIAATQFLMYTMCRKAEVLRARWTELDFAKSQWDIPAARMKSRRPHRVHLPTQAIQLLKLLHAKTGGGDYVFPSTQRATVPLVDCTLNHFFKRLDFGVDEFSPHGTRGTAATLLREHGFGRDVVELLLAHTEKSQTAAAYHHHELEPERRRALQYLADQIDRIAQDERRRRAAAVGTAAEAPEPDRALASAEAA